MKVRTYTPILKDKVAELGGLKSLNDSNRKYVVPLIQVVHKFKNRKDSNGKPILIRLPEIEAINISLNRMKDLFQFDKIFYDVRPLYNSIDNFTINKISSAQSSLFGFNLIPVFRLNDFNNSFNELSKEFIKLKGICIRIQKNDTLNKIWLSIDSDISKLDLKRSDVDIIIDFEQTEINDIDLIRILLTSDKYLNDFRSITFASGNYPKTLALYKKPGKYSLDRTDWILGKRIINEFNKKGLLISYGDYAIQSPIYIEPKSVAFGTRSVIYALENTWVIMKGQNDTAKNSAGKKQYYAHAKILVSNNILLNKCCMTEDKIINVSKSPLAYLGNFEEWLKFGVNHHLVVTLKYLNEMY